MQWIRETATSDVFELMDCLLCVASAIIFSEVHVHSDFYIVIWRERWQRNNQQMGKSTSAWCSIRRCRVGKTCLSDRLELVCTNILLQIFCSDQKANGQNQRPKLTSRASWHEFNKQIASSVPLTWTQILDFEGV